jgi:hypothetical protein
MAYAGGGVVSASRSAAEPLALRPRNSRVAANSPSLWLDHVLRDVHGDELVAVVHRERMADEPGVIVLRRDHVLNTFFLVPLVQDPDLRGAAPRRTGPS